MERDIDASLVGMKAREAARTFFEQIERSRSEGAKWSAVAEVFTERGARFGRKALEVAFAEERDRRGGKGRPRHGKSDAPIVEAERALSAWLDRAREAGLTKDETARLLRSATARLSRGWERAKGEER